LLFLQSLRVCLHTAQQGLLVIHLPLFFPSSKKFAKNPMSVCMTCQEECVDEGGSMHASLSTFAVSLHSNSLATHRALTEEHSHIINTQDLIWYACETMVSQRALCDRSIDVLLMDMTADLLLMHSHPEPRQLPSGPQWTAYSWPSCSSYFCRNDTFQT